MPSSGNVVQHGPPKTVGFSLLLHNTGMAMAGGLVSQTLKVLVLIYVARVYGPAEFGSFSFAYSVYAFLYVVSQFGLPTFAAREVTQTQRLDPRLFKSISEARLLLAVFSAVVALLVLSLIPQVSRKELYLVAGFGLSNVALAFFSDWVFQGLGKLHGWAALNIIWQGSWLFLTFLAVRLGASIRIVSFAFAAGALMAASAGWVWCRRSLRVDGESSEPRYLLRNVLKEGTHLGTGTMLQTFLVWIDIIVVRMLLGPHSAGLYAAGNRIALGSGMLAGFYMQGAFPLLSRSALEDPADYQRTFQQAYNNLSATFVPAALWGIFYAPEILDLIYKRQEYLAAAPVFQVFQLVLLLTTFGIGLYGLGVLLAFRQDRTYQRGFASVSLAYVVLCPIGALHWGITGAAAAALVVQVILFVLFEIQVRRFVVPRHAEALFLPSLLGLAAAALARLLHLSVFPALTLLALAYGVLGVHHLRVVNWRPFREDESQTT